MARKERGWSCSAADAHLIVEPWATGLPVCGGPQRSEQFGRRIQETEQLLTGLSEGTVDVPAAASRGQIGSTLGFPMPMLHDHQILSPGTHPTLMWLTRSIRSYIFFMRQMRTQVDHIPPEPS